MANTEAECIDEILERWFEGDEEALGLLNAFFEREVNRLSREVQPDVRPELKPDELVDSLYRGLIDRTKDKQHRTEFLAVAAPVMRKLLVNYAHDKLARSDQRKSRDKNADGSPEEGLVALDDAINRLAQVAARHSRVLELRYFGGLSIQEIADVLNVPPMTVQREWMMGRAWVQRDVSNGR